MKTAMSTITKAVTLLCVVLVAGCASFAYRVPPPSAREGGTVCFLENVPPVAQKAYQCGPAALESVFRYWGETRADADSTGRALYKPGSRGVLNFTLSQYARELGFWAQMNEAPEGEKGLTELKAWLRSKVPPIALLRTGFPWAPSYHFVVVKGFNDADEIFYANVGESETYAIRYREFEARWKSSGNWYLIICPPERVDWDLDGLRAADLALFCEKSGRLELAEEWYLYATFKNPENVVVQFNLANVYLKMKLFPEAKAIYTGLLKRQPGWGPPSNNLAWIYLEEGNPQAAIRVIETAFRNGAQRQPDIVDTLTVAQSRLTGKS